MLELIHDFQNLVKHPHSELLGLQVYTYDDLVAVDLVVWMILNFVHKVHHIMARFFKVEILALNLLIWCITITRTLLCNGTLMSPLRYQLPK